MRSLRGAPRLGRLLAALLLAVTPVNFAMAYDLDPNSTESVYGIAKKMGEDMLSFYHGDEPGHVPGLLPEPYYWWEAGAMLGALIEYWYYTGDTTWVDLTKRGLLFQVGTDNDYMPRNQTLTEGNDDQGFWGLAVMAAAEYNFPNPDDGQPGWLALAQAVFNTQVERWDMEHCNGGLRWQIFQWNRGWDYKNSISQGTFFALAARLALYTGNTTYADWAVKTWDWMIGTGFIDDKWYVYDGAHIPNNCSKIIPWQFSYNAGTFIVGSAAMYNFTEDQMWKHRLDGLLQGSKVFFTGPDKNIMEEVACEPVDHCNIDQQSFKAYLSRWLAATTQWVPDTYDFVIPRIRASAVAAAKQCTGGKNGRMCGLKWSDGKYDGSTGVGQQMAAMEVTLSCMIKERGPILTASTGGSSKGDPNAGSGGTDHPTKSIHLRPMTAGDKAGAAIVTAVLVACMLVGIFWLFLDETSDKGALQQVRGLNPSSSAAAAAALIPTAGAAAVLRKRRTRDMSEKQNAGISEKQATQEAFMTSPETSSTENMDMAAPAPVARPEDRTARHVRRASNMPLGWPHNPSLRGSVAADPPSERPISSGQMSDSPRVPGTDEINAAATPDRNSDARGGPSQHADFDEIRPASRRQ